LQAQDVEGVAHAEEAREAELVELLEASTAWPALQPCDNEGRSAMDAMFRPRPPRERQRAAGCRLQESASEHVATEALLERLRAAVRIGRYVTGRLPGAHCHGEALPACYRRAWTPGSHRFFPPPFRRMVMLLLLHSARPLAAESGGSGSSLLPATIWRKIFGFMSRDWAAEPQDSEDADIHF